MNEIEYSELRQRALDKYEYIHETGEFVHKTSIHRSRIGKVAGSVDANGYVHVKVGAKGYVAHRLAWLMVHGEWPSRDIDHINGDRADNRLANLRLATQSENNQNLKKARVDNASAGELGVNVEANGKFRARIMVDGKPIHLGCFDTMPEARASYLTAKRLLHPFGML